MIHRVAILSLLASITLAGSAAADWLVLRGGKKIETEGRWVVGGALVTVHESAGRALAVTLGIVDVDATVRANSRSGKPSGTLADRIAARAQAGKAPQTPQNTETAQTTPPTDPRLSSDNLRHLQEGAQRYAASQILTPDQLMARQQADVATLTRRATLDDPANQKTAVRPQPQPRSLGEGFDSTDRCKPYQDNPSAYNHCLSGH
ncbi:MAG: hypothetical protein M3O15_14925 [Acidobacteriota bacterium]|nr:hypothetical protein [Acidobacteriota bacterium]